MGYARRMKSKKQASSNWEISEAGLLWDSFSLADIGHVLVLAGAGLVSKADASFLCAALLKLHDLYPEKFKLDSGRGDIYRNRENWLAKQAPDQFGQLATGRARREATTVGTYLKLRRQIANLQVETADLAEAILVQAQAHVSTLMPDYTYLQPAQASTFGHYLLGFIFPLRRDLERLSACFARLDEFPGGIGSTNGSALPLDRETISKFFGFAAPVTHARDAMWQHDVMLEVYAAASTLMINLSRIANDFQIWYTKEFDFIRLGPGSIRQSVIMPQKNNPYALSFARGAANLIAGRMAGAMALGSTCTGQIDNRIFIYNELPSTLNLVSESLAGMTEAFKGMKVNKARMLNRASDSFVQSSDVAELIVRECGLSFSQAHALVRDHIYEKAPGKFSTGLLRACEKLNGKVTADFRLSLRELSSPATLVENRKGLGGASAASVRRMIVTLERDIRTHRKAADKLGRRLDADREKILARAAKLAAKVREAG